MKSLLVGLFLFLSVCAYAQQIVTGVISDENGKKLPNVVITVKGSSNETLSDENGKYSIEVPDGYKTLLFKLLDYKVCETEVNGLVVNMTMSMINVELFDLTLEELMNIKVVVSSTKSRNVFNTPSTVTVIDHDMLRHYNFLTIAEAVRTVSGIDINTSNLDINIPVSRGILQSYYANKVLILINNIPVWQPLYGNGTLDRVDVNDVERIEVLKGPASVLYGTNAYTGVINIVLRNKKENAVNAKATYGYPSLAGGGANVNFKHNDLSFFVSANSYFENRNPYTMQSDSLSPTVPYKTYLYNENDRKANANLIMNYKSHSVFMNTFYHDYAYPGVNISLSTGARHSMQENGTVLGYRFDKQLSNVFEINSQFSYDHYTRGWLANADATQILYMATERMLGSVKTNFHLLNEKLHFELGVEGEQGVGLVHKVKSTYTDTLVRYNMKNAEKVKNWSAFAQVEFTSGKYSLLAGTRFVNNNAFGNHLSSRITGLYSFIG